jgi:hypothetical protein
MYVRAPLIICSYILISNTRQQNNINIKGVGNRKKFDIAVAVAFGLSIIFSFHVL